jgi:hypothetical protein
VAPRTLRQRLLEKIAQEADAQRSGRPARIVIKMNQLEDPATIGALCGAGHRRHSGIEMTYSLNRDVSEDAAVGASTSHEVPSSA